MIQKIVDFFFIHAKCPVCGKIGHKRDMTEKQFDYGPNPLSYSYRRFYHFKCRKEVINERPCECGKHWVHRTPHKETTM